MLSMHWFKTAEALAQSILFFTSDEFFFITGTALGIDGGSYFH